MSVIVIGLGNPYLGDDAVGWHIIQQVEQLLSEDPFHPNIELRQASLGGISLMELLAGYTRAIVVDAIACENSVPGRIHRLSIDDLSGLNPKAAHANSVHDISFQAALCLGKKMGIPLPSQIVIIAVEINPQLDLSEKMSPAMEASILPVSKRVFAEIFSEC